MWDAIVQASQSVVKDWLSGGPKGVKPDKKKYALPKHFCALRYRDQWHTAVLFHKVKLATIAKLAISGFAIYLYKAPCKILCIVYLLRKPLD